MKTTSERVDVVIVGAGPAGLASAMTLGAAGIETLVVERRPIPSTQPRATTASTGTMELMRRWGLEQVVRERSFEVEWQAWATATMAEAASGEAIDVGFPTAAQAALVSPTRPAGIGQDELEPLLERHLEPLPSVRLERGVELRRLTRGDGGEYELSVAGTGSESRTIEARYVIAADGMHSPVRSALGIDTDGVEVLEEALGVTFRGPVWGLVGEHRYGIYFLTAGTGGRVFVPSGSPNRWVWATDWDEAFGDPGEIPRDDVRSWIRAGAGDPGLEIEIDRVMRVPYGVGLAERFRDGNVFLIGDAAHRVTPRGATGLNTAIRDGFDIGWKLAWVLRGWAGDGLLDSYEGERRPVAEFNTQRSTRSDGSIMGNALGLSADIGGRIPHFWVPRGSGLVSTLDLLGDGFTLFAGPEWDGTVPATSGAPVQVERLDAISARGVGIAPGGSLLARPDGHPVALWDGSATLDSWLPIQVSKSRSRRRSPTTTSSFS